jgi:hypothetical protein
MAMKRRLIVKPVVSASKEWYDMILHPNFLKALALATIAIFAVLSVTSEHTSKRVAALENVPHAERVIRRSVIIIIHSTNGRGLKAGRDT